MQQVEGFFLLAGMYCMVVGKFSFMKRWKTAGYPVRLGGLILWLPVITGLLGLTGEHAKRFTLADVLVIVVTLALALLLFVWGYAWWEAVRRAVSDPRL